MKNTQHFITILALTLSISAHPIDLEAQNNPNLPLTKVTAVRDSYPFWSPDGKQVVFQSDRTGVFEIYIVNTDGSGLRRITRQKEPDETPVWSPDGRKIAFVSNHDRRADNRGNLQLYIMNPDGSGVTKLLDNMETVEDARPVWSYVGTKILFNRQYIADESSIDIMILDVPEEFLKQ